MSPFLRRNDPAATPFLYSYHAAPSSTSPAFHAPARRRTQVPMDAWIVIALLSVLLLGLWTAAIYLFGPSLRRRFLERTARREEAKKAKTRLLGLGFGYDGLTEAAFEQLREQEEKDANKLPRRPPTLAAIPLLPPIMVPLTISRGASCSDDEIEKGAVVAATYSRSDDSKSTLDPAPVYERGGYQGTA